MGRHHENGSERRWGSLRWKGDTTDSIPSLPAWECHEGITEGTVREFTAAIRASSPPGIDVPAEHARYSWLIERCSDRGADGAPLRRAAWVRLASGYSPVPYPNTRQAAMDILASWLQWNGVLDPSVRALHTIWVRRATDAVWTERLDGR